MIVWIDPAGLVSPSKEEKRRKEILLVENKIDS